MKQHLLTKIQNRTATVAVIGLGYVGLPLAVAFVEQGFPVTFAAAQCRPPSAQLRTCFDCAQDRPPSAQLRTGPATALRTGPATALRTGPGIEVDGRKVAALNRSESYGQDIPSGPLTVQPTGRFRVTTNSEWICYNGCCSTSIWC